MSWENLARHVSDFDKKYTLQDRQPRDTAWRPVRFAVRDVIIGFVVSRLGTNSSTLEVDVFMSYDPEGIPGWSGTKYAMIYVLSQAYKCGSSMGIKFTTNSGKNSAPIPDEVVSLAEDHDIFFGKARIDEGVITPKKARHLFLALTEFSPQAEKRVMELSLANLVAPERICYMVHHQAYTREEMESILLGSEYPENILLGKVTPEEYVLYQDAVLRARDAVLGGVLDRALTLKEIVGEDGKVLDLEGSDRRINISFDSRFFAKVYDIVEETPLPDWSTKQIPTLIPGQRAVVMVRARDWADFLYYFEEDLASLKTMKKAYHEENTHFFLLVPRNITEIDSEALGNIKSRLTKLGVTLLIYPDSVALLDIDVMRLFKESETMRQGTDSGDSKRKVEVSAGNFDHNSTTLTLVSVPKNHTVERISLADLVIQALYDENELARGVNKHQVRSRHHLVSDRIQFLAHLSLLNGQENLCLPFGAIDFLVEARNKAPLYLRQRRMLPGFWMPEHVAKYNELIIGLTGKDHPIRRLLDYLNQAQQRDQVVIVVQNKHSAQEQTTQMEANGNSRLAEKFSGQFVPDWIQDTKGLPAKEAVVKHLWRAANSAHQGQANSVNLSEVKNPDITKALWEMVYKPKEGVRGQKVAVNIVYTDGSQARPFPLFCLRVRTESEKAELKQTVPIKIGMLSTRHFELDEIVEHYWFRNVEISQSGLSSAETDELCYQLTLRQLHRRLEQDQFVRFEFYQTGLPTPLIGFWRAVVDTLQEMQNKPPRLEVIPIFFEYGKYAPGIGWC